MTIWFFLSLIIFAIIACLALPTVFLLPLVWKYRKLPEDVRERLLKEIQYALEDMKTRLEKLGDKLKTECGEGTPDESNPETMDD